MIWLCAETQKEMWFLASDLLATPAVAKQSEDLLPIFAKSLDEWVERTRGKVTLNCFSSLQREASIHAFKNIKRSHAQQQWKKYFPLARTFCYKNKRRRLLKILSALCCCCGRMKNVSPSLCSFGYKIMFKFLSS